MSFCCLCGAAPLDAQGENACELCGGIACGACGRASTHGWRCVDCWLVTDEADEALPEYPLFDPSIFKLPCIILDDDDPRVQEIEAAVRKGDHPDCPFCGQMIKIYKRRLNKAMVEALACLVALGKSRGTPPWVHLTDLPKIQGRPCGGDFAKLRYWWFIVGKQQDEDAVGSTGFWAFLSWAERFLRGEVAVPTHAFIYDDVCYGFTPEWVYVGDIDEDFSLVEVLARWGDTPEEDND